MPYFEIKAGFLEENRSIALFLLPEDDHGFLVGIKL